VRRIMAVPALALLLMATHSYAQVPNASDTIGIKKSFFFGSSYRFQGKKIKTKDLRDLYKTVNDREPARLLERARRLSTLSNVVGWPGVPIAVYGSVHRNSEGKHPVALIVVGYGMQVIGGVLGIAADNTKVHSAEKFNDAVRARSHTSLHILPPDRADQLLCVGFSF
jgi:hypothetical protein